ncbi:MAG: hypothetical protein JWQ01_4088 [Massilia sp.]|nr:hypothetical protein [Massilia sp.]
MKNGWNIAIEQASGTNGVEAFVGLLRQPDGTLALRLPLGYVISAQESAQHCLGYFSRILARFASHHPDERRSEYQRDGYLRAHRGQSYGPTAKQLPGYSKVGNCLELIRRLRDPRLLALARMPGLSGFDARYISRNLERASYLPDGTPYFDAMWTHAPQLLQTRNVMVGLAAWVALDTVSHLFPGVLNRELDSALTAEWQVLADRFADDHGLDATASLYAETSTATLSILQTALEAIAQRTPPVHADARNLHEILDRLLNFSLTANNGEIWGLQGFHRVWEAACLEYAQKKYGEAAIFTCDDELLATASPRERNRWKQNRHQIFAHNGLARRPDLVIQKDDGGFLIVDFKYSTAYAEETLLRRRPRAPDLLRSSDTPDLPRAIAEQFKLYQDIANLESYRWLLMQHGLKSADESLVDLELWVPSEKTESKRCAWMAQVGGRALPESGFNGLVIVYQSTREIIGPYGDSFKIFE